MLQITAVVGLLGAIIMFCGDMLLYFTTSSYEMDGGLTPYVDIMKKLPDWRLIFGGAIGPIAAFLYCIGYYHITLVTLDDYRLWGLAATLLLSLGIIVGGAYHSQFTYIGLIGKTENKEGISAVTKNIQVLSRISTASTAIGSIILAGLILLNKTYYPQWCVVLTPLVLILLGFIFVKLPQPFRVVLFGGWNNLLYVIFFGASLILAVT